jgi:membrane-associated HD superfamily phosphohydrolase
MNPVLEPQYDPKFQSSDAAGFARNAVHSVHVAARAGVVNRTHRVVRERAKVMQEKRSRERSLMAPLVLCSVLLILSVLAVWTGLYQYQATEAAEAMQSDVAMLATTDNNHFMVALLWFVPVSVALLATVWVRRSRNNADEEAL